MPLVIDDRVRGIADNVVATLKAARVSSAPTETVFADVYVVDDVQSFINTADVLKVKPGSAVAGVVCGDVEESQGMTDDESASCRLPIDLVIRFSKSRPAGAPERDATLDAMMYAEIAKESLSVDLSRGGRAKMVQWGGNVVNGTDLRGRARLASRVPNQAIYTLTVPVAVTWIVPKVNRE